MRPLFSKEFHFLQSTVNQKASSSLWCLFSDHILCPLMQTCSDPSTQHTSLESPSARSEDGNVKEKLIPPGHSETIVAMTTIVSESGPNSNNNRGQDTPIVESHRQNKRTILKGKSCPSRKRIQIIKSSPTSGPASTSSARASYGWWTRSCKEESSKLWSPIEIDCVDSPSTSLNGYVADTTPLSWSKTKRYVPHNKNLQRTLWQSYMSSRAGITACDDMDKEKTENEEEKESMRCQKIRLKPTPDQAKILRKWMQAARTTYNMALHLIKDGKAQPNLSLKKLVVTSRREDNLQIQELKSTPADIRVRAVLDLLHAFKTAKAGVAARKQRQKTSKKRWKKKKKTEHIVGRRRWRKRAPFNIHYKSRRLTSDSFGFEAKSIKIEGTQLKLFSTVKKFGMQQGIQMNETSQHPIDSCCRIQYVFGRWYLLLPYKIDPTPPVLHNGRLGAYDAGIRSFITYYTDDEAGEMGFDTYPKIDHITLKIKSIHDKINTLRKQGHESKKIKKLKRAWYRANARSSHLADDLHWKTIKNLLDRFDVLIAPRLNVGDFVSKDSVLNAKTKRRLLFLRHGKFRERLLMKAKSRGKKIYDLEEHGTSKGCSNCGNIKKDLGSSKSYHCIVCGLEMDRDVNSSKNHVLKFLFGTEDY